MNAVLRKGKDLVKSQSPDTIQVAAGTPWRHGSWVTKRGPRLSACATAGADLWRTHNGFLERKDPESLPKSQRRPPVVSETATKRAIELKFHNDINHYGPEQETGGGR